MAAPAYASGQSGAIAPTAPVWLTYAAPSLAVGYRLIQECGVFTAISLLSKGLCRSGSVSYFFRAIGIKKSNRARTSGSEIALRPISLTQAFYFQLFSKRHINEIAIPLHRW